MSNLKPPSTLQGIGTTSDGATATPRQKFRKGDRSRRMWTPREEEILASCLVELVAGGWKSDNGFRAGYLQKIEDSIRIEFPNTDIQGTPHVTSRISAWKKSYGILRNILARTGVGFNHDGTHKIDCDDEQWAHIVMADKNARGMRSKSWPLWGTWQMIFGKDRASGGAAEEVQKAAAELRPQRATVSECNENNFSPSTDDVLDSEANGGPLHTDLHDDGSGNEGRVTSTTTKGTGKKHKVVSSDEAMMDFMAKLHADTNSRLDLVASKIGYEFDLGKARQEVFNKLEIVEGLSLEERYDLCNILGDKSQRLEIFIGMPAHARLGYLKRLLSKHRDFN
ncbi:uncharacterized protein LOC121753990 [Salvia splendens]|uniref:uncharacterized protein LOC121753990 n=1 Tax=Salvia splendens TaxID=180675 RepID=UPI001C27282B|nr:uncharacterized protein LOC121753990 [Salvia splendens]